MEKFWGLFWGVGVAGDLRELGDVCVQGCFGVTEVIFIINYLLRMVFDNNYF